MRRASGTRGSTATRRRSEDLGEKRWYSRGARGPERFRGHGTRWEGPTRERERAKERGGSRKQ